MSMLKSFASLTLGLSILMATPQAALSSERVVSLWQGSSIFCKIIEAKPNSGFIEIGRYFSATLATTKGGGDVGFQWYHSRDKDKPPVVFREVFETHALHFKNPADALAEQDLFLNFEIPADEKASLQKLKAIQVKGKFIGGKSLGVQAYQSIVELDHDGEKTEVLMECR